MTALAFYSLLVSVAMTGLWLVWRLSGLRNLAAIGLNRTILMSMILFSLVVALVPFIPHPAGAMTVEVESIVSSPEADVAEPDANLVPAMVAQFHSLYDYTRYAVAIYIVGLAISVLILLGSFIKVVRIIMKGESVNYKSRKIKVVDSDGFVPFTWGYWIVMPKSLLASADVADMVMAHESVHLYRRHWIDLMVANLVKCLTWYCPTAYMIVHDLAENHEFEADRTVVAHGYDAESYQNMLIKMASGKRFANSLTDSIVYKSLKSRITMMQNKTPESSKRLRALWLAPVCALMILASASPALASYAEATESKSTTEVETKKVSDAAVTLDYSKVNPVPEGLVMPVATDKTYSSASMNIRYPESAQRDRVQDKVVVELVVGGSDGAVQSAQIMSSLGNEAIDNEVLRVAKQMANFQPATYKGSPADVNIRMCFEFKLQSEKPVNTPSGYVPFYDHIVTVAP